MTSPAHLSGGPPTMARSLDVPRGSKETPAHGSPDGGSAHVSGSGVPSRLDAEMPMSHGTPGLAAAHDDGGRWQRPSPASPRGPSLGGGRRRRSRARAGL